MSIYENGRVHIISPDTNNIFNMQDKIPIKSTSYTDALTGTWCSSMLSNHFFSAKNINKLQDLIVSHIYSKSNGKYKISHQDEDTLKTIMRSIYLQHSKNNPNDINSQIQTLNKLVLDYAVGQIYGEIQGYINYKIDASTMYNNGSGLIDRPIYVKNSKQLEFKKWF